MLPQTHFLVAFLLGLIGVKLGYLTLLEAFIAGLLSIIIDLDHLFNFKFNLKKTFHATVINHEHETRSLHHWVGFLIFTAIIIFIGIFFLNTALILAIAYYSHYLLDNIHINAKKKFTFKEFGFVMKLYYFELIFQIVL